MKENEGEQYQNINKDMKAVMAPHSVNLSSFLEETHRRTQKKMEKMKHASEILQSKYIQYKKRSLDISDLTAPGDTHRESSTQIKSKTIGIDQILHQECKIDASPRLLKMKKSKLYESRRKMKKDLQEDSKERFPMINLGNINQKPLK